MVYCLGKGELYSVFFVTYTGFVCSTLDSGPKIMEPPPSFRLQKSDMKQVPYWGSRILECTVNPTVTWYLVLDAFKWMHFCMQRKE
jgi:hypothetical protein